MTTRPAENSQLNEWRQRFERHRQSGKPVATFCRNEGVSVASFYQWRKKLAALDRNNRAAIRRNDFATVQLIASAHVSVQLPGGTCLNIPMVDAPVFETALEVILAADAQQARGATC
jgi:hypothetical protein